MWNLLYVPGIYGGFTFDSSFHQSIDLKLNAEERKAWQFVFKNTETLL